MRKHSLYATRETYTPITPAPVGDVLLALRPRLSPLFAWDSLETPDPSNPNVFRVHERPLSDHYRRHFDLERWTIPLLTECPGQRTAQEVFLLPQVLNSIPAEGVDAKLDTFGGLLQELA